MFLKEMFLAIFFILKERISCSTYCTACSFNNICTSCDMVGGYYLQNGNCIYTNIENCKTFLLGSICLTCNQNYYMNNAKCVAISTLLLIPNCLIYASSTSCILCDSTTFLNNFLCWNLKSPIAGCEVYDSTGNTCLSCLPSYYIPIGQQNCQKFDNSVCSSLAQITCQQCKPGYFNISNKYIQDANNFSDNTDLSLLYNFFQKGSGNYFYATCVANLDLNCLVRIDFQTCSKCSNQYYLDSTKKCVIFPSPAISNCIQYSNLISCSECSNGFYLSPNNFCLSVTPIKNCQNYSQTSSNLCIQCVSGFFSSGSVCTQRVNTLISNCQTLTANADNCSTCLTGFILNSNGFQCLSGVINCLTYQTTQTSATCTSCTQGYILSPTGTCIIGTIINCIIYANSGCSICANGYYLINNGCQQHPLMQSFGCLNTDNLLINLCTSCSADSVMAPINGICLQVNIFIKNCLLYASDQSCQQCDRTISYKSSLLCIQGTIDNCILYDLTQNLCIQCGMDPIFGNSLIVDSENPNNNCVPINNNFSNNCNSLNIISTNILCTSCVNNHYPYSYTDVSYYFCFPLNSISYLVYQNTAYCVQFNSNEGRCRRCVIGYIISIDGSCISQCPSNQYLYHQQYNSISVSNVYIEYFMYCSVNPPIYKINYFSNSILPCYLVNYITTDQTNQYCLGCRIDEIGIINRFSNLVTNFESNIIQNSGIFSYFNFLPIYTECVKRSAVINQLTTIFSTNMGFYSTVSFGSFVNCKYGVNLSGKYGCFRCNMGYSGPVLWEISSQLWFVPVCDVIPNCNKNIYYSGIQGIPGQLDGSPPFDQYLSCHFCTIGIPTFARTSQNASINIAANTPAINQYDIFPQTSAQISTIYSGYTTFCSVTLLKNCAVQEHFPDAATVTYESYVNGPVTINPVCVACKPGFSGVLYPNTRFIQICNQILNCDNTNSFTFNYCGTCLLGFAFQYAVSSSDTISTYSSCVACPDINCFVYDTTKNQCFLCKKGFILNADFICDSAKYANCSVSGFSKLFSQAQALVYGAFGIGCNTCETGFIAQRMTTPITTCIRSEKLENQQSIASSLFLIQNCSMFGLNSLGKIACTQCQTGFIPSPSQRKCWVQIVYLLGCIVYDETTGKICVKCQDGYYLNSSSQCSVGNINYCLTYKSLTECLVCQQGYSVFLKKGVIKQCFLTSQLNCLTFDSTAANTGNINCLQCVANFYWSTSPSIGKFPLNYCLKCPQVNNCLSYDNQLNLATASLNCTQCRQSYYLYSNTTQDQIVCNPRNNQTILNCLHYGLNIDGCSQCKPGYFVNSNFDCQIYPTGIQNCTFYTDAVTCTQCDNTTYLSNRTCNAVPQNSSIANCNAYNQQIQCITCNPSFFLNNATSCVTTTVAGCNGYLSPTVCATCATGFGFLITNNQTQCSLIDLGNCEEIDTTYIGTNFKCKTCSPAFYLDSNQQCSAVPIFINNCIYYASINTCKICKSGYVLNFNQKLCINSNSQSYQSDSNCLISLVLQNPICNICNQGYYISNNTCVLCTTVTPGCLVCNYLNPSNCTICATGYSMKSQGICTLSKPIIPNITNTSNSQNTTSNVFNFMIHCAILLIIY